MAANLNINITGPSGGGAGSSTGGLNAGSLRQITNLLERQSAELEKQTRLLQQQGKAGARTYQQLNVSITQTANTFTSITNESKKAGDASSKAADRAAKAWAASARQIRSSVAGAFSGITSGRAFRTSGRGGLSPGGLLAGLGDVSAIGVRVAGDLVGGITKGLAGGVAAVGGGVASLIAKVPAAAAGVVSAGAQIATNLVSGLTSALGGAVSGIASVLGDVLSKAAGIAGKTLNVALTGAIGVAIGSAFKAAKFENVSGAFGELVKGIGGGAGSLERFRSAAKGTVSDLDLLSQANNAILLGAVQTEGQFDRLIEAGRRLGKATGRTAAEGIADLSTGIGRQSRLILDNLGLIVKAESSYERYASAVGKTVAELDDAEKKLAFQQAAFAAIEERLQALGPETETFGDKFGRLRATIENTAVAIGQSLLPVLEQVIEPITRVGQKIAEAFSRNREAIVAAITSALEGFLNVLRNVANILESEGFGGVFERLRTSAESLWQTFRVTADASIVYVGTRLSELWTRTQALIIDALTKGFRVGLQAAIDATPPGFLAKLFGFDTSIGSSLPGNEKANDLREKADAQAANAAVTFALRMEEASQALAPAARVFRELTSSASGPVAAASRTTQSVATVANPPVVPAATRNALGSIDVASLEAKLTTVITDFSNLSDAAQEEIRAKLEDIAESGDRTTRFIRKLEQSREDQRLAELEASAKANANIVREYERNAEKITEQIAKSAEFFAKKFEDLEKQLDDELARIGEAKDKALADIDGRVASAAEALRGGSRSSLPLNVFKAIEKVQRQEDRDTKELLKRLTSGLSSQDLAANGGALLDQVLQQAAEIQTGAEGLRIDAILQANADIATAVESSLDAQDALIEAQEETATALTELLAAEKEALDTVRKVLEKQTNELNTAKAERKELRRALALLS